MSVELTEEQRAAVEARGQVFLSAGAGSGKTRVLVERVARAVEAGVDPAGLVVVTYTEKAARELAERVRERLADVEGAGDAADRVRISTIHGLCGRLLREHAAAAGVDPDFRVLAEGEAGILASEAFGRALRAYADEERADALELLAAYGADRLRGMLATLHARLRSDGLPLSASFGEGVDLTAARERAGEEAQRALDVLDREPNRQRAETLAERCTRISDPAFLVDLRDVKLLRAPAGLEAYEQARVALEDAALGTLAVALGERLVALLIRFDEAYSAAKASERALDFEDLQLRARDLLTRDEAVRARVQDGVRELLVDEFQDTNRLQVELLDLFGGAETFFVGDEFQAIYRFRHADVGVYLGRREEALTAVELRGNFRARPEVLAVVNDLFGPAFGEGYRTLAAAGRFDGPGFGHAVELCIVERELYDGARAWRTAEAALVAGRVRAAIDADGYEPRDVVVLLRSGTDARIYEDALAAEGLPTASAIGRGYWGRQQVLDLLAYLRLIRNRYDDNALLSVLASPLVGVSNDALLRTRRAARAGIFFGLERTLPEGLAERDLNLLRAFRQRYDRLVAASAELSLEALLERIVNDHDYDLACLAQPDGRRRFANVRKLIRLARDYEALRGPDLPGFIAYATSQAAALAREPEAALAEEEGADAVRLMTIHAAKGLEFPVVVVADTGRGQPPMRGEIVVLGDGRAGLRVPDASGRMHSSPGFKEAAELEQAAEAEEQQRVIYVAATRAIDRLIVSGASKAGDTSSPLGWLLAGLAFDPAPVPAGEPYRLELPGGGAVVVHVARPEEAAPAPDDEFEPEQLTLDLGPGPPVPAPAPFAPLEPLAPLPEAPSHVPRELSFTALALHERCGYRYFAERVLGLPAVPVAGAEAAGEGIGGLAIGEVVHAILETGDADELERRYPHAAEPERERVGELVAAWERSPLAQRVGAAAAIERELPFAFAQGGVVVRGYLDLLAREDDGTRLIVDYKTNLLGGRSASEIVDADYALQRSIYALAALRGGAEQVEVAFVFLDGADEVASARYGAADADALAGEISAAIARLRDSSFAPRPSPRTCADCPALDRICAGMRLDEG